MELLKMKTPLVEMDGDEMTRVIWQQVKEIVLQPFVDLKTEYFDLGLSNRDATDDQVTIDAAERTRQLGVAVKCATITPNAARMDEYHLKQMWKSPNATIRALLDGTVFRAPIMVQGIDPVVTSWKKPITIARHAYGDIYKSSEIRIEGPARVDLLVTYPDGTTDTLPVHQFQDPGIVMGMHNTDRSIRSFARSCFTYALDTRQDVWFGAKDTISKIYDHRFKDLFEEIFQQEYKERFQNAGISYFYTLIDDVVARVVKSDGGFLWACKNYDGDVMSDMVASANGSLSMMTSVLVSPEGVYEYEAAHGTVTRHYYRYLKGEKTSTNPIATLFAWTGALGRRAEMDGIDALSDFARRVEAATMKTIAEGVMTGDLAPMTRNPDVRVIDSAGFLAAVADHVRSDG